MNKQDKQNFGSQDRPQQEVNGNRPVTNKASPASTDTRDINRTGSKSTTDRQNPDKY